MASMAMLNNQRVIYSYVVYYHGILYNVLVGGSSGILSLAFIFPLSNFCPVSRGGIVAARHETQTLRPTAVSTSNRAMALGDRG